MSLAFDLALELSLGAVALTGGDVPPPPPEVVVVRKAHQLTWGRTEIFVHHTAVWG
jgi:hypothetical protein